MISVQVPQALTERYEILDNFSGGQSVVFKAKDKKLDRLVAIKMPDMKVLANPKKLEKFVEEGRKLARMDDPNVLSVFHFFERGEIDDCCYLVTPWMDQSLQDLIDREELTTEAAVRILRKILQGIRALHQEGIIHRDLKPANIYLSKNAQQVKVGDLGIATDVGIDETLEALDMTPKYYAPELFELDVEIDRRSDIYSLGMLAYEMLVGKTKFEKLFPEIYGTKSGKTRNTRWLNWHRDRNRVAPPLREVVPEIPAYISDCVERMLAKDPNQRFPNIDAVLVALDKGGGGGEVGAEPAVPFKVLEIDDKPEKSKKARRGLLGNKWVTIGGGALLLILIAVVLIVVMGPRNAKRAASEAGVAMNAARAAALKAEADQGAGKKSFDSGEASRALGDNSWNKKDYEAAERAFREAKGKYETALRNAQGRPDPELEAARQRAADNRARARQAGAEKFASFEAAQQVFDGAQTLAKEGSIAEAINKYKDSATRFGTVTAEAGAISAFVKMKAAYSAAVESGIPPEDEQFKAAMAVRKSGLVALKDKKYVQAEQDLYRASAGFDKALKAYVSAPVTFMAGSSPAQIDAALRLCAQYQKNCKREWFVAEAQREVQLTPFQIDKYEVTNRDFELFVTETGYVTAAEKKGYSRRWDPSGSIKAPGYSWRTPEGPKSSYKNLLDHPVVHVNRKDAEAYCAWAKKRLPTEDEWEYVARGPSGSIYPWGNQWEANRAVWNGGNTLKESRPAGSIPAGGSPGGVQDLVGNVWEWTSTNIGEQAVLKGGSWVENNPANLRPAFRRTENPEYSHMDDGFRCARDVKQWTVQK